MKSLDVARLQRVSTYPAVSLLLPIDGQPRDHVRLRLRGLASETVGRLLQEFDPTVTSSCLNEAGFFSYFYQLYYF